MLFSYFHLAQVDGANVKVTLTARGPSLIALTMTAPPGAFFISPQGDNHVSDDDDGEENVGDDSETVFVIQIYQIYRGFLQHLIKFDSSNFQ